MILVDSSVWIDYLNDVDTQQTVTLDSILMTKRVAVGDLIMTEVLQGSPSDKDFNTALRLFGRLHFLMLGGHEVALASARNYRKLRSLGYTTRKTIDALIATRCILGGIELLHNDRDFIPFEKHLGLKCVISSL